MDRRRVRAFAGCSVAVASVGAAALASGGPPQRDAVPVNATKVQLATALTSGARAAQGGLAPQLLPADLRAWVAVRARAIPLPDGGNFNGIRWETAPGAIPVADAEGVLELNARCQWWRAERDGREKATARRVLATAAAWPAVAATRPEVGLMPAASGDGLAACDRSAERERAWARRLGLRPTA